MDLLQAEKDMLASGAPVKSISAAKSVTTQPTAQPQQTQSTKAPSVAVDASTGQQTMPQADQPADADGSKNPAEKCQTPSQPAKQKGKGRGRRKHQAVPAEASFNDEVMIQPSSCSSHAGLSAAVNIAWDQGQAGL